MPTIRVFDPAMCCATGVCGPTSDPDLARFSADLAWLQQQGVAVERFNLSSDPGAFVAHAPVREALHARGNDVLPLVMVDDRVAVEGAYPTRETLAALAGVVLRRFAVAKASACCAPSGGESATTSGSTKTSCC